MCFFFLIGFEWKFVDYTDEFPLMAIFVNCGALNTLFGVDQSYGFDIPMRLDSFFKSMSHSGGNQCALY